MRQFALLSFISIGVLSCAEPSDRPAQMGFRVRVPQITLDRLDDQLHLRIFPIADRHCDTALGQVVRGGVRVTDFPGQNVNPLVRCDQNMWGTQQTNFGGVANPYDACFSKTQPQMVQVPGGNYIVLVEGSGAVAGAGGTMPHVTLGSGCAEVVASPGASQMLSIEMREQANVGMCGDSMVQQNESCDTGTTNPDCDDQCQFPERLVNTTVTNPAHRPSLAWAESGSMMVAFDANDDVWLHEFDANGGDITSPVALANDNGLDATPPGVQQNARIIATTTGFAATWQSTERTFADFDVDGTFSNTTNIPPVSSDVLANTTSMANFQNRINPTLAAGTTSLIWLFEDQASASIRIARTALASPPVAPTADSALVASGASSIMAATPSIVPAGAGFIATWSAGPVGNRDVYAVRLDAAGAVMGTPMSVNMETGNDQDQPAIAVRGTDVVIAWRDASGADASDNSGRTIRWRRFDTMLVANGGDHIAPTTVAGDQITPTIALSTSGVVLIAWENAVDGAIRGRMFHLDATGFINRINATDADFVVNATGTELPAGTGPRHLPSAGYGGAQRFAVAWEDAGTNQIKVRTLRAD